MRAKRERTRCPAAQVRREFDSIPVMEEHPEEIGESDGRVSERAGRRKRKTGVEGQRNREIYLSQRLCAAALCRRPRWEVRIFRHFFPISTLPLPSPHRSTDLFAFFLHFDSDTWPSRATLPGYWKLRTLIYASVLFRRLNNSNLYCVKLLCCRSNNWFLLREIRIRRSNREERLSRITFFQRFWLAPDRRKWRPFQNPRTDGGSFTRARRTRRIRDRVYVCVKGDMEARLRSGSGRW